MSSLLLAWKRLVLLGLLGAIPLVASAQNAFSPQGGEYAITGSLPGDQVFPQVKLNSSGGFLVWQDNMTDGDGLGISAQRIDVSLSGTLAPFRVNEKAAGDQENAQLALLNNGGAVFVWQGGPYGFQHIYARFLAANGTFVTGDVMVNTWTIGQQINPAVAALADGNVVFVWSSFGQDGSLQGVFAQRFSSSGEKLDGEFRVNQTTQLNQRTPAVAVLANGNFIVTWISEKRAGIVNNRDETGRIPDLASGADVYTVDVFGRIHDVSGNAVADEFKINTRTSVCANPAVSGSADGGFAAAWSERAGRIMVDGVVQTNGWDVAARSFGSDGAAKGDELTVNTETYGDQFAPKIAASGIDYLIVWTSLWQDGSFEGVYGQSLSAGGGLVGSEFQVNTTAAGKQFQPSVASDGGRRFLVVWSSFVGGISSFDLFAQRYTSAQVLAAPAAPYVSALSQSRLSVTWPDLAGAGLNVESYHLYLDGASAPTTIGGNMYSAAQLAAGTSHTFRLAYKLADGRVSPLSPAVTGTTWGDDGNFDGLPNDWQTQNWGPDLANWPAPTADTDGDGATTLQEFLAGTNPKDPNSVLRTKLTTSNQGWRLNWNTQPGLMYQVQTSTDVKSWIDLGSARFAPGDNDSIPVNGNYNESFYRVIRLR
ncbi:MAG: hypothetical protein ABI651_06065 [Verrucomicrobiota bacterium]